MIIKLCNTEGEKVNIFNISRERNRRTANQEFKNLYKNVHSILIHKNKETRHCPNVYCVHQH